MASKKSTKPTRIDQDFLDDLKAIAKIRLDNGLAKLEPKETSPREMTRLLRKTVGYRQSLKELKFKPRKEDLGV